MLIGKADGLMTFPKTDMILKLVRDFSPLSIFCRHRDLTSLQEVIMDYVNT